MGCVEDVTTLAVEGYQKISKSAKIKSIDTMVNKE
jgi:hypothetical protein